MAWKFRLPHGNGLHAALGDPDLQPRQARFRGPYRGVLAWKAIAHVMLSFGFEGKDYLAVSIEMRKEKGESYQHWGGGEPARPGS
jgi:hypothetical protein